MDYIVVVTLPDVADLTVEDVCVGMKDALKMLKLGEVRIRPLSELFAC